MTKQGPWTFEEKTFIRNMAGKISPEEIAVQLDRSLRGIRSYMSKEGYLKYYTSTQLAKNEDHLTDITKSHYWNELKQQFDINELELFKYHWTNVTKQFKEDVLHTEELQIVDMIKLEILMNRLLSQQTDIKRRISALEDIVASEKKKKEDANLDIIRNTEIQIASLYAATESISKEFRELLKEKTNMFKNLKATRAERIKNIESSKESMAGWYKQLISNPRLRQEMGLYMEKMRIATEVEYERLSEPHQYCDGNVDNPLLTPENQ